MKRATLPFLGVVALGAGLGLAPAAGRGAAAEGRFKRLDRNGDGTLSRQEIPRLFDRLDADGDGAVTRDEARRAAERREARRRAVASFEPGPVRVTTHKAFTDLTFVKDYEPGTRDPNSRFMGGTETLRLMAHKGKLFASMGYWTDKPYGQAKGDDPWTGAPLLRKDSTDGPWRVDVTFGRTFLRVEGLISARLTTDATGAKLGEPVTMLVAGPSSRRLTVWTRNDETGMWTQIEAAPSARGGFRCFCTHLDRETGVHHLFGGSKGFIARGAYDPAAPGRLRWSAEPELTGTGRVMCMAEADGVLYAACGIKSDQQDSGGLFRRIDGPRPRWELVYRWPYFLVEDKDESEILRGLTAVPDPSGGDHEVLLGTCTFPGVVYRIDPTKEGPDLAVREFDIRTYFTQTWHAPRRSGPCLSAYNRLVPATDPETGEKVHLIPVWAQHPAGRDTELGSSAWYLVRHGDGTYAHGRIFDPKHPAPNPGRGLTATRTIEVSPFPEDKGRVIYCGGFDCASRDSHNTSWIYRGVPADPGSKGKTPPPVNVRKRLGVPYAAVEGVDPNLLSLDLYAPADDAGKHPVMVMVHGGGWRTGDKANPAMTQLKVPHFVSHGWVYVSLNYRLSPKVTHPVHTRDVAAALAWLHDHVGEYGGDPDRIFIMGHSAGAHLVGLVATDDRYLKAHGKDLRIIKGVISLDNPGFDIPRLMQLAHPGLQRIYGTAFTGDPAVQKDASPIAHLAKGKPIPPFLIIPSGRRQGAVREISDDFARALGRIGVPAGVVQAVGKDHGRVNRDIGKVGDAQTRVIMAFLNGADPRTLPKNTGAFKAKEQAAADAGGHWRPASGG